MLQRTWVHGLGAVLAVAIATLLVSIFHEVVTGAMKQGEQRRANDAQQAMATWRCRSMGGTGARDACLLRLRLRLTVQDEIQASHPAAPQKLALVPAGF